MMTRRLTPFFLSIFILTFCSPAIADLVEKTTSNIVTSPDVTMSLLKVTGGLLLVILAIFGSAWVYRRYGNMTPVSNDALRVIGGISMGQKERVVLMQVGEEQVLLGVSPGRIECLHVLRKNVEVNDKKINVDVNKKNKTFSAQLSTALKQRNE